MENEPTRWGGGRDLLNDTLGDDESMVESGQVSQSSDVTRRDLRLESGEMGDVGTKLEDIKQVMGPTCKEECAITARGRSRQQTAATRHGR